MDARYGRLALSGTAAFILLALLALSAVSWAYTATQAMAMRAGSALDALAFLVFLTTWVVMMAAMMFPSVAPVVLVYTQQLIRHNASWAAGTALFVGGYLAAWTAFGVGAYVVAALTGAIIGRLPLVSAYPQLAVGAVFALGGLYQLTPLKDRCLGRCRTPIEWVLRGFRPGTLGALRMGLTEGAFCVGCCVGLMVILLAVGMASVAWMAIVAAVIFLEKVLSPTPRVARLVAAGLVVLGVLIATVPPLAEVVLGPTMQQ